MKNGSFIDFLTKIETSLLELDAKNNQPHLIKKLIGLYPTIARVHGSDLEAYLNDYQGSGKVLEKINFVATRKMKEYLGFKIDHTNQKIILHTKGGQDEIHSLVPVPSILEQGLNLNKNTRGFWLLSSFFCQEENLGEIQIYNIFVSQLIPLEISSS